MTNNQAAHPPAGDNANISNATGARSRRWLIAALLVATVITLVLAGLPYGIGYGINQWFTSMGARSVEVDDIDFNPFTGRLHVENLRVTDESDATMRVKAAQFEFAWLPLWNKQFLLEAISIEDGELRILRDPEGGWFVGFIALVAAEPEALAEPSEWQAGLREIELKNLKVNFSLPQFSNDLYIKSAAIQRAVVWEPDVPATITADYTLDDAPAELNAEIFLFRDMLEAKGELKIKGVGLERYLGLMEPTLNKLSGTANADLTFSASVGDGFTTSTEGSLSVEDAVVAGPDFEAMQQLMAWNGRVDISSDNAGVHVQSEGTLEANAADLKVAQHSAIDDQLKWSGSLSLMLATDDSDATLTANGALDSGDLTVKLTEPEMMIEQSGLSWRGMIEVTALADLMRLNSDGALKGVESRVEHSDIKLSQSDLAWEGQFEFETNVGDEPILTAEGSLATGKLDGQVRKSQLRVTHKGLEWSGRIGNAGSEKAGTSGSLTVKGPALSALKGKSTLASADELRLKGFSMPEAANIDVADMQVKNLAIGVSGQDVKAGGLARAGGVKLSNMHWRAGERAAVESAVLENLDFHLVRTPDGDLNVYDQINVLTGGGTASGQSETQVNETPDEASAGQGPEIAIGRISITGDSRFRFEDKAVKPAALFDIALQEAEVNSLDSAQPAQESPLKLSARLGKNAHVSVNGYIKPFAAPFEADLEGKISNLHVQDISPYAASAIGYELTQGRFTALMEFKTEGGKVEGDNELIFNELEVKPVPDAESKLSVPLETGLAMLRDKEGRIKLNVPVSGDIDNPNFSATDAINQALVKATEKAAVGYLALTLQPWGAILLAADLAKDFGANASAKLDSIAFDAGSKDLKPEYNEYLTKLAKLLDERPDVQLRLCGRAVKQDEASLVAPAPKEKSKWKKLLEREKKPAAAPPSDDDLVLLARDRATVVLENLVENHGVPAERVYTCDPKPELEDEGEPRVDIGI